MRQEAKPEPEDGLQLSVAKLESDALNRPLHYRLALPRQAAGDVPLVLLLHGSGGSEYSWDPGLEALSRAVAIKQLPPLAAVAPASGTSWWVDGPEATETAVTYELLPMLTAEMGLGLAGVFVAGFSMGGFGAVRYALRYPERFAGAIVMSAALYDELPPPTSSARSSGAFGTPFDPHRWSELNYPSLLKPYLASNRRVPVYIAVGDGDWNEPAGWRFNSEYQSVVLFERLSREGGSPARIRIDAGGHDWGFWRPKFLDGLNYLLMSGRSGPGS